MQRKALGKGLEALFGPMSDPERREQESEEGSSGRRIISVPVNDIIPNRSQPREVFDDEAMEELKKSIAENGILEPPVVRRKGDFFELVAGERRYRAAKELGFETIDVILMEVDSDEKMIILSLVENIQREDLNAIEEAKAYRRIMEGTGVTQEQLSEMVGKSRSAVANTLRLLSLSKPVQDMVSDGILAPGSARTLVPVEDRNLQLKLARRIAKEGLSSRKAEALVRRVLSRGSSESSPKRLTPFLEAAREDLQRVLSTEVKIKGDDKKGKIEISYYSCEDLERIIESIAAKKA